MAFLQPGGSQAHAMPVLLCDMHRACQWRLEEHAAAVQL